MGMLDRHFDEIFGGGAVLQLTGAQARSSREWIQSKIVAVDIENVAKWFYEENDQEYWDWREDFPTQISPWPLAWYEWPQPEFYLMGEKREASFREAGVVKTGVSVCCLRVSDKHRSMPGMHPFLGAAQHLWQKMYGAGARLSSQLVNRASEPVSGAHWLAGYQVFVETARKDLFWLGMVCDYLDADGKPIIEWRQVVNNAQNVLYELSGRRLDDETIERLAQMGDLVTGELLPLAFAISLLHCKNTTVQIQEVPERLQKARQRRGRPPLFRYHVLEIEPMRRILRSEGRSHETGLRRAMHICRGHFKDYRERGLFGKETHKGIYWWDMHVRGSAKDGVVVKDYTVKAPV